MRTSCGLCAVLGAIVVCASAGAARGQSLFQRAADEPPPGAVVQPARSLYAVSLYAIEPPRERVFAPNDLITIIVREDTRATRDQEVKEEKKYENTFSMLNRALLEQFLQLRLPTGGQTLGDLDLANSDAKFRGKGEYDRTDRIESRVTARVVEVKPNGTLLVEARTVLTTDQEVQTITLSGLCRGQDVTRDNTVLSTQLYGLNLNLQHEGQVRRATRKGLIPRVIETLFNF